VSTHIMGVRNVCHFCLIARLGTLPNGSTELCLFSRGGYF
jgi:hypothetical protein